MRTIDWTLLAISSASEPMQPVQLQKALFLFDRKVPDNLIPATEKYAFSAYDYGPFSPAIYSDAEQLEREGWVSIKRPPDVRFKEYSMTQAGAEHASRIGADANSAVREYLRTLVSYTQSVSFSDLVASIYREFPDMKVNSVFKESP